MPFLLVYAQNLHLIGNVEAIWGTNGADKVSYLYLERKNVYVRTLRNT